MSDFRDRLAEALRGCDPLAFDNIHADWACLSIADHLIASGVVADPAEVAELRATLAAVSELAKEAISGIGGSHSHWREGGAGGVCRTCARANERQDDLRERLDTVLARSDHAAAEGKAPCPVTGDIVCPWHPDGGPHPAAAEGKGAES